MGCQGSGQKRETRYFEPASHTHAANFRLPFQAFQAPEFTYHLIATLRRLDSERIALIGCDSKSSVQSVRAARRECDQDWCATGHSTIIEQVCKATGQARGL